MNTSAIKWVSGIAWAAVAVASAVPASANAFTTQSGSYASCTASYTSTFLGFCLAEGQYFHWASYQQNIKFVTPGCSSGGCGSENGVVYTDQVYAVGRKVATGFGNCEGYNWYGLGTCAC